MKSAVSMLSLFLVALATMGGAQPEPETGTSVFVKSPTGGLFNLPVELTDTVKAVKMKIQEKEKIPADKQKLFFNAKELEDQMTLEHYKIKNHSILKLVVTPKESMDEEAAQITSSVRIFIKTMNLHKTIAMTVDLTETVKALKASIETKEKIPADRQRLFFGAQQLEDDKTLASYNIKNDSTIRLFIHGQEGTQIFVKNLTKPKTIAMTVDLSQTVHKLKAAIEMKETIPVANQYLLFGSKLMEDKRTLIEYDVKQDSTIQMLALPKCISGDN